jgi:GWxTD domain-containing protein
LTCCAATRGLLSWTPRRLAAAAALAVLAAAGLAAGACASTGAPQAQSAAAVTNPSLSPEYATWMVGPVALLATPQEVGAFLALSDDAAAQEFIRQFWQRRNPTPDRPGNPVLATFEQRAAAADRLYTEAGLPGRRTPRGTIYVLYGRPAKTEFEDPPRPSTSTIEVWVYGPKAASGLDGKRPAEKYRWVKRGDLTVPYSGALAPAAAPVVPLLPPP